MLVIIRMLLVLVKKNLKMSVIKTTILIFHCDNSYHDNDKKEC